MLSFLSSSPKLFTGTEFVHLQCFLRGGVGGSGGRPGPTVLLLMDKVWQSCFYFMCILQNYFQFFVLQQFSATPFCASISSSLFSPTSAVQSLEVVPAQTLPFFVAYILNPKCCIPLIFFSQSSQAFQCCMKLPNLLQTRLPTNQATLLQTNHPNHHTSQSILRHSNTPTSSRYTQ